MTVALDRIVITGVGVASPLGHTREALFAGLLAGRTAICEHEDLARAGYRVPRAARIADLDGDPLRRGRCLALLAAERAVLDARVDLAPDCGVFVGSTLGESFAFESAAEGRSDLALDDYGVRSFGEAIQARFRLRGKLSAVATACAAGNYALGAALHALQRGQLRMAVAGASEPFSRLSLVGFSRSRAMAADSCRPFDAAHSGMSLAEGAAMFVLESARSALQRGARPLAEVAALGLSCDAHHPTAPEPEGRGMLAAMKHALAGAQLELSELDWINVHGSGTRASDSAETKAIGALCAERMPLLSGSKGALGHALGAASALETAICVQGLCEQMVPPTAGHSTAIDPKVACTTQPTRRVLRSVMNNAFAFGGVNSALVLRSWRD